MDRVDPGLLFSAGPGLFGHGPVHAAVVLAEPQGNRDARLKADGIPAGILGLDRYIGIADAGIEQPDFKVRQVLKASQGDLGIAFVDAHLGHENILLVGFGQAIDRLQVGGQGLEGRRDQFSHSRAGVPVEQPVESGDFGLLQFLQQQGIVLQLAALGLGFDHVGKGDPVVGVGGFGYLADMVQQIGIVPGDPSGLPDVPQFVIGLFDGQQGLLDRLVQFEAGDAGFGGHQFAGLGQLARKGNHLRYLGVPVLGAQAGFDGFGEPGDHQLRIGVAGGDPVFFNRRPPGLAGLLDRRVVGVGVFDQIGESHRWRQWCRGASRLGSRFAGEGNTRDQQHDSRQINHCPPAGLAYRGLDTRSRLVLRKVKVHVDLLTHNGGDTGRNRSSLTTSHMKQ